MPHRTPADHAGAWWHITNRGLAKRTVFENGHDIEQFLSLLEAVVLADLLEVHAFAILTTHFHLLVRSLTGELPRAMHWLMLRYVRWFNRARKRDGSLFRGRYRARLIEDDVYWETVVRYIDLNPVRARMCRLPSEYPFGSARLYARPTRPAWLATDQIERTVAAHYLRSTPLPTDYDRFALAAHPEAHIQLVEHGLENAAHARTVPLTDLVRSASRRQQQWFAWKARLADGTHRGTMVVPECLLIPLLERLPAALRDDARLRAGLLSELASLPLEEIARRLGCAVSTAHGRVRAHARLCESDEDYRRTVARIVDLAVRQSVPMPARAVVAPA